MDDTRTLTILTGPTAVGKTALALAWAQQHDAEIISCDSTLFYRGMDIGTAKPSPGELAQVRHHLIDVAAPHEQLTVVDYLALAKAAVADIQARGKRVLVTGGSGFYLAGYLRVVTDGIAVSDEVRARVASLNETAGLAGMLAELGRLSPEGTGELDTNNPRRVAKALERCLATGRSVPQLEQDFAQRPGAFDDFPKHVIRLTRGEESLHTRIARRTRLMLEGGLIEEVRRLRGVGFGQNPSAAGAIGYRETLQYIDGELTRDELEAAINQNTRRLVAKQRKWFRNQLVPDRVLDLDADETF